MLVKKERISLRKIFNFQQELRRIFWIMSQNNIEANAENCEMEDGPFRKKIKLEHDLNE